MSITTVSVIALAAVLPASADTNLPGSWWNPKWAFCVPLSVEVGPWERTDAPAETFINFTTLLAQAGQSGTVIPESLRLFEVDLNGTLAAVPCQYDPFTKHSGTLVFLLSGTPPPNTHRHYQLYFDVVGTFEPEQIQPLIELTDDVLDEGMATYRVKTPAATYFYQKEAGGLSSLLDIDGNDWISFHPWGGSDGIYRGIPNLVHPDNIFHPGHANCTSSVRYAGPLKVTIHTLSKNGLWQCLWEIYPAHARLTILQAPEQPYWFLYEGTPGGSLDLTTDYCVRSNGLRTNMTQSWTADVPLPEWVYFEDSKLDRYLYFVHEDDDGEIDSFYQMEQNMTVFGFGRSGLNKYLTGAPRHFTIGLADNTESTAARKIIEGTCQPATSMSGPVMILPDLWTDFRIDARDLAKLASDWLHHTVGPPTCDLTGDKFVDLKDFARFAQYWNPKPEPPSSMEVCWSFDQDSTNVAYDNSPYGNHGVIVGARWTPEGRSGGGLVFDGKDDYVTIKGYPGVTGGQPRTVAAWIKTQVDDYVHLVSWGRTEPGQLWVMLLTRGSRNEAQGALRVAVGTGFVTGQMRVTDGQWHHVAAVLEASDNPSLHDIRLYVDGKPDAISALSSSPINTATGPDVTIGVCLTDGHYFFDGAIDNVQIYNRALPVAEIRELASTDSQ